MSAADWIGWAAATAIFLLLGAWLHWANRKPADERIESLAIGGGWIGFFIVAAGRWAGVA